MMRIYVASLADYNAGRLHGVNITIDGQDVEEIQEAVQAMLAESREPIAEEWAIHDYEGFGNYQVGEWEDFRTIALFGKVAAELSDEDTDAFLAWIDPGQLDLSDYWDDEGGLIERFREQYLGKWDSFRDFVIQSDEGNMHLGLDVLMEEMKEADKRNYMRPGSHTYEEMFERLTYRIDWDGVTRDLESYYTTASAPDYGVFVFDTER